METPPTRSPLHVSTRAYERLLALYPARYRAEYGPAMAQLFRDLARESYGQSQGWGLARLWVRVLADTSRSAGEEHWQALNEGLRRPCGPDMRWMRTGWPGYLLAAVVLALGLIAKALVLRQTQSPAATAGVLAGALLLAGILLDRALHASGHMLAATAAFSASLFLPLAWAPDAPAWLRDNPSLAYLVLLLPFGARSSRHPLRALWACTVIYVVINLLTGLVIAAL